MAKQSALPATWQVPDEFRSRLGSKVGRQRAMLAEGHLLLVLHKPPRPDEDERQGRYIWRQPSGEWACSDLGGGAAVVAKHVSEYATAVEKCEQQEEGAATSDDYFLLLEELAPLHRAARNLHSVLQDARKMVPDDRDIIDFRDRAYELQRTCELSYNGAKNSLEFAVAKRSEEQARASHEMSEAAHRLNVLAAFFFPLATLSSVFGMSMLEGPPSQWPPSLFFVLCAVGLATGFLLKGWVTGRRRDRA